MLGASLTACEDDIDRYNVSGIGSSQFSIAESEIVIDEDNFDVDVLNLIYDKSTLLVNGSSDIYTNLNGGRIILQASTDKDFSKCVDFDGTNLSSVSGATMNAVATKLGLKPNVSSTIYLRLVTSYGANTEETYVSNVVTVPITPFELDSHWAYLYMSEDDDVALNEKSTTYLYSVNDDGNYAGFINSVAWQKIVIEYDNAFYGTGEAEGWSFLMLGKYDDIANCHTWFTGLAGCYYLQADLKDLSKQPDLYLISSLSCSGDCPQATMVFDKATSTWNGFINVSKDNATITVSGLADHYSEQTAPDATVDCGFSGSDGKASFAVDTEGTGLTGISKGTYKLSINVAKNSAYKYTLEAADIVVYPSTMTINGNELNTETLDGAATGVYTGFLELNSGAAEFKDAEGNVKNVDLNLEKDGWYMVTLDLAEKTASAVLYGNTLTVSNAWTGTLTMKDGKYSGLLTNGTGWDFNLTDENGQTYGTFEGWNQYTFGIQEGSYDHLWVDNSHGDVFVEIDPANHRWTYAYENALLVVENGMLIGETGANILTTLTKDGDVYKGVYDVTSREGASWNYYLQGLNSTKDGIAYYGCDDDGTKPSGDDADNYACVVVEREFEDACTSHTFWVNPESKYNMTVDLSKGSVSFEVLIVPTAASLLYKDGSLICDMTVVSEGVFTGVLPANGDWTNFVVKGIAGDVSVMYGSDDAWSKYGDEDSFANGWAKVVVPSSNNLYCNTTDQAIKVTVDLNAGTISYAKAE